MTISSETIKQTFLGNGAQTVFGYTFLLPSAAQYQLYYVSATGVVEPIAQSNYTVSGIGNPAGGNITYLRGGVAIASGTSITIVRAVPYTQTTDLTNQGAYYPAVLEAALDRLDMQIQQLYATVRQVPRAPVTDGNMIDLPTAADRAGKYAYFDGSGNLTTSTAAPPVLPTGSIALTGTQDISMLPTGNPVTTLSSLTVTGTTASSTTREFLASFGLTSNRGSAVASPDRDKVTLYAGMVALEGTGDVWALNTVTTLNAGATVNYNAYGYELDFNNLNAARGSTPGAAGLAAPIAYGLGITGVASFPSTSGLLISGATGAVWYRGITFTAGIVQSSIQDLGLAERAIDLRGSYSYAIDLSPSVSSIAAIQMGNGQVLRSKTVAAVSRAMLALNASDQIVVGDTAQALVLAGSIVRPSVDNAIPLGSGTFRFTEVFAANGTINTSDAKAKEDMAPLPSALAVLRAVKPISYRFKVGGADETVVRVKKQVPLYRDIVTEREQVVLEDGKAVLRKVSETVQERVTETIPVIDEHGRPVMRWAKPVRGASGEVLQPGQWVPQVHVIHCTEEQEVDEVQLVPRPGKRTHVGFSASQIKSAIKKLGLGDIGAYVKTENGMDGLRHDQLAAVLWRAVQEIDERLQSIEPKE
jgi:hypothetical protein